MNVWAYVVLSTVVSFPSFLFAQQGCIRGNCTQGYGTYVFEDGSTYSGDFRDGYSHGLGIYETPEGEKYSGNWIRHKREGKGRLILPNGDLYLGDFKAGMISGQGEMWFREGDYYNGNWEANLPQGQGIFAYADGFLYKGHWRRGFRHGFGVFFSPEGDSVSGEWFNGFFWEQFRPFVYRAGNDPIRDCNRQYCNSGIGTYVYPDGTVYKGQFRAGKPFGPSEVKFSDGRLYLGSWQNDKPNGPGLLSDAFGNWQGGNWKEGRLTVPQTSESLFYQDNVGAIFPGGNLRKEMKIYAVIIGAAAYTRMPLLHYADDDALRVYHFLKSPEGGALPDDQIALLTDREASYDGIVRAMEEIFGEADANDMILFYFSGHGMEGAFVPIDSDGDYNRLPHRLVKDMIINSSAKYKLVIADACHSGGLLAYRDGLALEDFLKKFYSSFEGVNGGLALLMSSKSEEYSMEDGRLRSGVFSYFMIEGLKGAADVNDDAVVSISELAAFVSGTVRRHTGNLQNPVISGNFDRSMPVGLIRK